MPADEVTHGTDVEESRARTGPRHAAPKKPLFTRFHMPAGKAIALAAMPTAVLMGMGFTPTLANAEDQPASKSLTADEYKDCVAALEDDASASASPSASASDSDSKDDEAEATPSASASSSDSSDSDSGSGSGSSSDSGSDDEAEPTPSASTSSSPAGEAQSGATATPSPSASESSGNVLEEIGDAITGIFTGGESASPSASASPSPSASASENSSDDSKDDASDAVKDTTEKVTDTVEDTVKDTTDTASKAAEDTTEAVEKAAEAVTASPTASSTSSSTDVDDCPVATDAEGGVDNAVPLPADPWYLNASSLLLKGADYKGIVKVRTADGTVKEVLKYVISDGTDIGDLHQTVKDEQSGKTYHVQAAEGSTSTIRDGDTVMYTESISGNLLGLIPVTFSPKSPPPLNIPLIYFTKVTVVQAGQFGGTLHVPGLHNYTTD